MFSHLHMMLAVSFFAVLLYLLLRTKNAMPWSFPLIGISPWMLRNKHRHTDALSELLESSGGTFLNKSRFLLGYDMLFTSDPSNVHHIMSQNFKKYPKGLFWRERFDIFGVSMFNADFEEWSYNREVVRGFLSHQSFKENVSKTVLDSMQNCLVPFLDQVSRDGVFVDLQDVFHRLMFDLSSVICAGHRSNSLSLRTPSPPFIKAIDDALEAALTRHFLPNPVWKLQKRFLVGQEKKMKEARDVLDRTFEMFLSMKKKDLKSRSLNESNSFHFDLLEIYLTGHEVAGDRRVEYELMKDNVLALLFAMGDTTALTLSWVFLLLSRNPHVEEKIRDEVSKTFSCETLQPKDSMVYVHACICETLRLYPVVPFEERTPIEEDTLPSGHKVDKNTVVTLSTYAMGRTGRVWGEDCREFKPERWITEEGRIKHEPPHKFFSFNAGPRICPGKDFAFNFMKIAIGTIIMNYNVQIVEDRPVVFKASIVLSMKDGLKAKITKASVS